MDKTSSSHATPIPVPSLLPKLKFGGAKTLHLELTHIFTAPSSALLELEVLLENCGRAIRKSSSRPWLPAA